MTTPQDSIFAGMRQDQFCTGAIALDKHGVGVDPTSTHAVKWCAYGWIKRCCADQPGVIDDIYRERANAVARQLGYVNLVEASCRADWAFIEALQREMI